MTKSEGRLASPLHNQPQKESTTMMKLQRRKRNKRTSGAFERELALEILKSDKLVQGRESGIGIYQLA